MPRYVILTYGFSYLRHVRADPALRRLSDWVDQVDVRADGRHTYPYGDRGPLQLQGQRVMVRRIPSALRTNIGVDEARDTIMDATLSGYRDAAMWAGPRGVVGVVFDHGDRAVVQLAPFGMLTATRGLLQTIYLIREGRYPRDQMTRAYDDMLEIGAILRRARVAGVEFLSCRIGAGQEGRDLLNWLHVLWGVPVRALMGDLVVEEDDVGYRVFVVPPGAGTTRLRPQPGGFYSTFDRTPPTGPGLWQLSSSTVPAIIPALTVPPFPSP